MSSLPSIRGRLLIAVLAGAVLPLAGAGWWLSRSAVRAAEGLLSAQLDSSLALAAADVQSHWEYRRADLLLLASNAQSVQLAATGAVTRDDSAYLHGLFDGMRASIPVDSIVDAAGRVRWSIHPASLDDTSPRRPSLPEPREHRLAYSVPITDATGRKVGELRAQFRAASLASDSAPVLVKGARFAMIDRDDGVALGSEPVWPPSANGRVVVDGQDWIARSRALVAPRILLSAAAPASSFVAPFARESRIGLILLLTLTAGVIVVAVYATARLTRDIAQQEALTAMGEFAATMSHEVRNALSAVRVDVQRTRETMPPDDDANALLTRALHQLQRIDATVTGALGVARGRHNAMELVDVKHVLTSAATSARDAFASAGGTLTADTDSLNGTRVRGNGAALEQLFLNLLLNAGQSIGAGGRTELHCTLAGDMVSVEIRDTGRGMTDDEARRAGTPFYTSKPGGTGLGLTIARRIATAHGGTIELTSVPAEGTTVVVRLPIDR